MFKLYLVTGATGYLGSTVIRLLKQQGAAVRALALPGDALAEGLGVDTVYGRVDEKESLAPFFDHIGPNCCLIHCAGIVSIASKYDGRLWSVNVKGTQNLLELCREHTVARMIYVSSVHAIPEKPKGQEMDECSAFDPGKVTGAYAKSKAAATALVLDAARKGLNVSVVHPSGIIGPYDNGSGSVTGTIISYCRGRLPMGVQGGYDFVDVRDVAQGILSCCEKGTAGECYILCNRYAEVREILETLRAIIHGKRIWCYLPLGSVKLIAPLCERHSLRRKEPLFLTPYSVYTMGVNARFSYAKAARELDYHPRDISRTLEDMVCWLRETGKIPDGAFVRQKEKAADQKAWRSERRLAGRPASRRRWRKPPIAAK